jgi:hypothetical protein
MRINESLNYMDLGRQVSNVVTIDEYIAKIGKNKDIITLTFKVNSKLAADDLSTWFERGYNYVLDASVSDGEVSTGKYLVFVELARRSSAPRKILTLLSDLDTLTGIEIDDWKLEIDDNRYRACEDAIKEYIVLNPNVYNDEEETDSDDAQFQEELNEYRSIARIDHKKVNTDDEYITKIKSMAGII